MIFLVILHYLEPAEECFKRQWPRQVSASFSPLDIILVGSNAFIPRLENALGTLRFVMRFSASFEMIPCPPNTHTFNLYTQ